MNVNFLSLAEQEMHDAFEWYEHQFKGLGDEFLFELNQAVIRIRQYPESCPVDKAGMRRVLLSRFPYGLWYVVKPDSITVYAVAHLHREPNYWIDRSSE